MAVLVDTYHHHHHPPDHHHLYQIHTTTGHHHMCPTYITWQAHRSHISSMGSSSYAPIHYGSHSLKQWQSGARCYGFQQPWLPFTIIENRQGNDFREGKHFSILRPKDFFAWRLEDSIFLGFSSRRTEGSGMVYTVFMVPQAPQMTQAHGAHGAHKYHGAHGTTPHFPTRE
jgi:hypothetical protein